MHVYHVNPPCTFILLHYGCLACDLMQHYHCVGGVQKPQSKNLVSDPKGTLGISESGFGFTKKNEVSTLLIC